MLVAFKILIFYFNGDLVADFGQVRHLVLRSYYLRVFFSHVFLFIVKQFVKSRSCQKLDIDFSLDNFQLARTLFKRKGLT